MNGILDRGAPDTGEVTVGSAVIFKQEMRDQGVMGVGTGQQLSKVLHKKMCFVVDWEQCFAMGIATLIEQNFNTHQVGAVIVLETVPPCCLIELHYIHKGINTWQAIIVFFRLLRDDRPFGVLNLSDFGRK